MNFLCLNESLMVKSNSRETPAIKVVEAESLKRRTSSAMFAQKKHETKVFQSQRPRSIAREETPERSKSRSKAYIAGRP